ncbi:MAG TPA: hypothetical protein DCS43_05635 [Verrucomicrobia bacterium]|nr:hypothetical protein [Verrucomicrobiota bacterium]
MLTIHATGIDTDAIIRDIHAKVKQNAEQGVYHRASLGETSRQTAFAFKDNAEFLRFYLETLRENAFVDIADFEITEKRPRFRRTLIALKKTLWSLLRFYTYRLWSQQNQINGLLLAAAEGIHEQQNEKIAALEARLAALEQRDLTIPHDKCRTPR